MPEQTVLIHQKRLAMKRLSNPPGLGGRTAQNWRALELKSEGKKE
jgi:hypothetical protein